MGSPGASGITNVHGGVSSSAINTPAGTSGIQSMLGAQTTQSNSAPLVPKAYINYLFFDEQFKCVGSGFSGVGGNSIIKDHHNELQNLTDPKNGFIYIYASNESPVNVFFDNLR